MIKILDYTPMPISHIGKVAGVCYNSDITNQEKNYKRGLDNLKKGHGRTYEYADVTIEIDGYSARAVRQLYTHVAGTSRLQASTRYINYGKNNFKYYIPESIESNINAKAIYDGEMQNILTTYNKLIELGIDKEDAANVLPLGLFSKVVLKINLRALMHLAEMRLCERAYKEIQDMVKEIMQKVGEIDCEWNELMTKYMKPKCKYCTEKEDCPKTKKK